MSKKAVIWLAPLAVIGLASVLIPGLDSISQRVPLAPSEALAAPQPASQAVLAFNVGGVLTRDGMLWIFRPDLDRWLTVDEAFREEGRETHILPLPVPVQDIGDMETYGFILTKGGDIWFYEIAADKWRQLQTPGRQ